MGDALDKASSIWSNLLTPGQLKSLGIKDEEEAKPNKRPAQKGQKRHLRQLHQTDQHLKTNGSGDGQDLDETRGHYQCSSPGTRVCSLPPIRGKAVCCQSLMECHQDLAEGRPQPNAEAHDGTSMHDRDLEGSIGQTARLRHQRARM